MKISKNEGFRDRKKLSKPMFAPWLRVTLQFGHRTLLKIGLRKVESVQRRFTKQEAQLMLTTGSTRLAVSRGQQTWYHSTCYI